jgi:hypothetical protein
MMVGTLGRHDAYGDVRFLPTPKIFPLPYKPLPPWVQVIWHNHSYLFPSPLSNWILEDDYPSGQLLIFKNDKG